MEDKTVTAAEDIQIADMDRARADLYNFLGALLAGPPDEMAARADSRTDG